ncbi:glycoside hydrolase family 31 protein [Sphingomonas sp. PR090111-T3T-6A]|uniref:glycoside hydrolase family 31 protein n=1 Tax=Sphingomonas sp. PR090111-T3T-6A TaxID=685778 RepID=UPI00037D36EC|nr:TIM-barrel domain-containing protein [Sphingomonas sp. PR090111-T3T-6A]
MKKGVSGLAVAWWCLALGASAAIARPAPPPAVTAGALVAIPGGVEARRGAATMRVTALTDSILRVRTAPDGHLPEDASWAVDAAIRAKRVAVTATPDGFATTALRVHIDPATGRLTVTDPEGRVISRDAARPMTVDGQGFTLSKHLPQSEHIFGLGDKTGGTLDRRGMSYVDWNTDAYGFNSSTDPIYKSIPFFIGVGGEGGSYGILFDNTWRVWFDFGHRDADLIRFGAPGGPIDYYVIAGPTTAEVVRRYTDLTGRAPLAPLWSLGYQQSRYSYMDEAELKQVAARLRSDRIPTDVLWLDIDFQDRNRPFTINTKAFPDFAGMTQGLRKDGFRLVTIADLHVAAAPGEGYAPYDQGMAGHHFVRDAKGQVYVGEVWPGPSVFPDFTDAATRKWYGTLFRPLLDAGVAGIWNDMNEPSVFKTPTATMPVDNIHRVASDDFAPREASHAEIHNVYGMENTRATFEGLSTLRPDERPFVMTRASYAGGQRYSATWTGDNSATWDHLKLAVHQVINLGLSGFSYSANDVGGFTGGPSADLLTRWFEISAFMPLFRDHAAKDTPRAEPWVDGPEHLAIRRRFIEERYRLLPYLYALADENARTGDPIMRPVFYDYPDAIHATCDQSMSFTLGRDILVAPPPKPESPQSYDVCLPAGGWYDYWTGRPVTSGKAGQAAGPVQAAAQTLTEGSAGGSTVPETPKLDTLPVFVRAGAIIPRQPLVQSTSETPQGPLSIDVYPGQNCEGDLYLDDGHSLAYRNGAYFRRKIRCTLSAAGIALSFDRPTGHFAPWWHRISLTVHGWKGSAGATVNGKRLDPSFDAAAQTAHLLVDDSPDALKIELRHQ